MLHLVTGVHANVCPGLWLLGYIFNIIFLFDPFAVLVTADWKESNPHFEAGDNTLH